MRDKPRCEARRYNNTMMCGLCGLQWDVSDDEPPQCSPAPPLSAERQTSDKRISIEKLRALREEIEQL